MLATSVAKEMPAFILQIEKLNKIQGKKVEDTTMTGLKFRIYRTFELTQQRSD